MRYIEIGLSRKYHTLVSDEDYDWLMQWKWTFAVSHRGGTLIYARRSVHVAGTNVTILMHHEVMRRQRIYRPRSSYTCDHIDGYSLNNQRENLTWATAKQQAANPNRVYPYCFWEPPIDIPF